MATPLSCRRCTRDGKTSTITVERGVQKRKYNGRMREHVNVTCGRCGWEWWSVNKEAIRQSRERDALARAE